MRHRTLRASIKQDKIYKLQKEIKELKKQGKDFSIKEEFLNDLRYSLYLTYNRDAISKKHFLEIFPYAYLGNVNIS